MRSNNKPIFLCPPIRGGDSRMLQLQPKPPKEDISTLQKTGHFYLVLTVAIVICDCDCEYYYML